GKHSQQDDRSAATTGSARVQDNLLFAHVTNLSTTNSRQSMRAETSSGSTAGKTPTRIWFLPSLRYGSMSTTPLALRWRRISAASTPESMSNVTTTGDRFIGFVMYASV